MSFKSSLFQRLRPGIHKAGLWHLIAVKQSRNAFSWVVAFGGVGDFFGLA